MTTRKPVPPASIYVPFQAGELGEAFVSKEEYFRLGYSYEDSLVRYVLPRPVPALTRLERAWLKVPAESRNTFLEWLRGPGCETSRWFKRGSAERAAFGLLVGVLSRRATRRKPAGKRKPRKEKV